MKKKLVSNKWKQVRYVFRSNSGEELYRVKKTEVKGG